MHYRRLLRLTRPRPRLRLARRVLRQKIERRCTAERATKTAAMHALRPTHGGVERAVSETRWLGTNAAQQSASLRLEMAALLKEAAEKIDAAPGNG